MEGWSIRPVSEDDLPAIAAIESSVHPLPWTHAQISAELEKPFSHILVATDDPTDAQVAGYIVYWLIDQECRILNLAVSLAFRGLGFGKALMRKAIGQAMREGATRASLEVRKSNEAAIQLYQGIGFVTYQIRKNLYSDGEDGYLMELSLEGAKDAF